MKITKIEIYPVTISKTRNLPGAEHGKIAGSALGTWEYCRFVVAKVFTDTGVVGYGEAPPWLAVSREAQSSIVKILQDYLAPAVMGMDPFNIVAVNMKMERCCPANPMARCVIDMAMYDIVAKTLNQPLYNIIGGKIRDRIPLCGLVHYGEIPDMITQTHWWKGMGYGTIRLKMGRGIKQDEQVMAAMRKEFGDDLKIRVDINQAYSVNQAKKFLDVMEQYDVELVEQPVHYRDFDGMAEVSHHGHTPIMAHESLYDIYDAVDLIKKGAIGLLGLKLDRPGGISNALKGIALGELFNIPCSMISSEELGVSTAASMHLAATIKKLDFAGEATGPLLIEDDIVKEKVRIEDGCALVPEGPGFGVEIDDEKLNYYCEGMVSCDETCRPLL